MDLIRLGDTMEDYAAREAIRLACGQAYDFLVRKLSLATISSFREKYIDYCEKLLHVKTLASPDRAVFIDDIYVPLRLKGINTMSTEVGDGTVLDTTRGVVIKGLAGMGKSTILRKLLANNARSGKRLPLFYELKHYAGGAIEDALIKGFANAGIEIGRLPLEKILRDSNVTLYLDAFDEAAPQFRDQLLDEIGRILNRYNCHVICTTRPDTELNSLAQFETYKVDELSQSQIFQIVERTSADLEKSASLCAALEKSPFSNGPESILKSPILVVLFCVSYNLGEEIPSTLSQFYENIFETIFYRHDNLKGKVNRVRYWNDNRRIYRALFEYFCFITLRSSATSFSWDEFVSFVSDALLYMGEKESLSDIVAKELTTITNLVIEDGFNEYRYIHKSIQEFFAAAFVLKVKEDIKTAFYTKCREDSSLYATFSNTLFFLEEIDYYDYSELLYIPAVSGLLSLSGGEIGNATKPPAALRVRLGQVIGVSAKHKIVFNSALKRSGVEDELYEPAINDQCELTAVESELFIFVAQRLITSAHRDAAFNHITENGTADADSVWRTDLGELLSVLKISESEIDDALILGINVLFRKKYNAAVGKVRNRARQLKKQKYLEF